MLDKLFRFSAIAFPGGYKFLAVMLITNFSNGSIAEIFSEGFFWVLLFLSFSGIPVASMMSSRTQHYSNKQKYGAVLLSTAILMLVYFVFIIKSFNSVLFVNIALASIFVSIYEFIRKDFFNEERYNQIFGAGGVSVVLILVSIFMLESLSNYLLALSMFFMLIPALVLHLVTFSTISVASNVSNKKQFSIFLQYAFSNAFSTSLAAALPLLLIAELGSEYSVVMAQVVALSKMLLLIPKAMAASNIPKLRNNGPSWEIVKPYCKVLNLYFLAIAVLCVPVAWLYDKNNIFIFYLLLLNIQISQLALPYSNVLAVEGNSKELLLANIKGTVIFALSILPVYIFMNQSYSRGVIILMLYFVHNGFKFSFTRTASLPFIK